MADLSTSGGMISLSQLTRRQIAKDAFYGCNEQLANHIKDVLSYEENGRRHPANGFGLEEAIAIVGEMDERMLIEEYGQYGKQIICNGCEAIYNELFLTGDDDEDDEADRCILCGSADLEKDEAGALDF